MIEQQLCDRAKQLWEAYLQISTSESLDIFEETFHADLVMIGTGKHEFYDSSDAALASMRESQAEMPDIEFEIIDEWYACRQLSREIYLVYGTIWVKEKDYLNKPILIEMDTRFSMVYRLEENGNFKLMHTHHSMPNVEQQPDEYYPRTISEKANKAMELVQVFQQRAEKDLLSGLLNRVYFEKHVENAMRDGDGVFYMIDLDNFKEVNDTLGHSCGDKILVLFANLLFEVFGKKAILGRMGGDEFAAFEVGPQRWEEVERKAQQLITKFKMTSEQFDNAVNISCSIGISQVTEFDNTFVSIYKNADYALYHAKKSNKAAFRWY